MSSRLVNMESAVPCTRHSASVKPRLPSSIRCTKPRADPTDKWIEIAFEEKLDAKCTCWPSFHMALAMQPHHIQSTAPYIREGRLVIEWHSLAVARARRTATENIMAWPLR